MLLHWPKLLISPQQFVFSHKSALLKIPSNKIADVISYFKSQLQGLYEPEEIHAFIRLSFEHYLNISPAKLLLKQDERLTESELLKFNFVVKDLKKHKPIQYILGVTEFYGLMVNVNPSVLIPRPETEELVDWIIKDNKSKRGLEVIDLCTGSGCIAIALNKNLLEAKVSALDISADALKTANSNALLNNADVDFFQYDILKCPVLAAGPFDIIVSNPPYVTGLDKQQMHPNVLDYEPHLALFVEDTKALVFYEAIAQWAKQSLKPGGILYFEINEAKGKEIMDMLDNFGFKDIALRKDLSGKERMARGVLAESGEG
jgi:release factor glutamine methyltransferase